jgi:hypothetical protein
MWLSVLVDIITIAAGIAIILLASYDRPDGSAERSADDRSSAGADARENRAGERTGTCADCGSGRRAGNGMVVGRRGRAAA